MLAPVTDQPSAKDFLYAFGRDRYLEAVAIVGVTGVLRYGKVPKVPDPDVPPADEYWARIVTQIISEDQETLRNGDGVRRFCTVGQVFVQLFAPVTDSRAAGFTDQIAEYLKQSFRKYQGDNLEFTNPAINDNVASEPNWIRANVVCNFQYRQFTS